MAGGHRSYIQFAPETTAGTPVAALYKQEIIPPFSLNIAARPINDPSLYNSRNRRQIY